jgi:hypothetical protein
LYLPRGGERQAQQLFRFPIVTWRPSTQLMAREPPPANKEFSPVTQVRERWQNVLFLDPNGLFELAPIGKSSGDPPHRHRLLPHVAQPLVDRQLLLPPDLQRPVEIAARLQDVGLEARCYRRPILRPDTQA